MKHHVAPFPRPCEAIFAIIAFLLPTNLTVALGQSITSAVSADYFPLAVGNHWSYKITGKLTANQRIRSRAAKWSVDSVTSKDGVRSYSLSSAPATEVDEPWILVFTSTGVKETAFGSPGTYLLRYPVKLGDKWDTSSSDLGDKQQGNRFEVTAIQATCVVGKFSFKDCVTVDDTQSDSKILLRTTYANGVGPVRYVYYNWNKTAQISATLTIQSWEVKKA